MFYLTSGLSLTRVFPHFLPWFILCSLLFIKTNGLPKFCNEETSNCTYQLRSSSLPTNSCLIHQTKTCKSMSIPSTQPLRQLPSEDDATFEVNLIPYILKNDKDYSYALNLTLDNKDDDTTGFFVFLQQDPTSYNICRVFDFSGAKKILPEQKINLYYECFAGFLAVNDYSYNVTVRAHPINQELKFWTYIPRDEEAVFKNVCYWAPLLMLNLASSYQRKVDIKFSTIDPKFEIESYSVKLTSKDTQIVKSVPFPLTKEKKMHRVVLEDLPGGKYDLAIVPNMKDSECPEKVLMTLIIPDKPSFPWYYIVILIVVLAIVLIASYFYFKRCRGNILSRPKALILYSEDCPKHLDVVLKLCEFLKYCCSLNVILDKWNQENQAPEFWYPTLVQEVDFFILVVSKGVKHKTDQNNEPEMIEKSPWGDLFLPAYRWLLRELTNKSCDHRLVKVVFSSYCQNTLVPKALRRVGKTYDLMKDINSFLCHIHSNSKICGLKHMCLVMPGSQYKSHQKGIKLKKAIDAMSAYQDSDPDWFDKRLKGTPNSCSSPSSPDSSGESFCMSSIKGEMQESLVLLSSE